MTDIAVFFIHGLVYAGLLFLISSGLTMVFGMMNVLNLAHASFYMLGAYLSYTILQVTGNFYLSLIICPILLFGLGMLVQRFLLSKAHKYGHVHELLITFGVAYVITEAVKWIWGNYPLGINLSGALTGSITLFGQPYPVYRLFMLGCAIFVCLIMAFLLYKTRLGIIVRASVDDHDMVNALGINVPLVFMCIFGLGAALSGFAGVIAGPLLTTYPGMAADILIDAFVVIVIGGMGSLGGALVASLMIGELQTFGAVLFPKLSLALMYLLMAIVLVVKPSGLFGEDL
jgi:branched-chain amino acid transport system permease protein